MMVRVMTDYNTLQVLERIHRSLQAIHDELVKRNEPPPSYHTISPPDWPCPKCGDPDPYVGSPRWDMTSGRMWWFCRSCRGLAVTESLDHESPQPRRPDPGRVSR